MKFYPALYKVILIFDAFQEYDYRGKGPRSYIGLWALGFIRDIDKSEEEQIIVRDSQLKSHK